MSKPNSGKSVYTSFAGLLLAALVLGGVSLSLSSSESGEDLSDNETCLDCHMDEEHVGLINVAEEKVHNPHDGSLKGEAHKEFACIDCHMDIEEIPHKEDVERTVECSNCHDPE